MADVAAVDARLAAALPSGALFAVGGRVRDEVRSALDGVPRPAKDLDYVALGLTLEELLDALRPVGRAEVAGAWFPVVKCVVDGETVDVALPRREHSTGVGHGEFAIDAAGPAVSLEQDLARRDFRMNMLARAIPSGELVDPYGGAEDVRARRIDILRPETFVEDPLRLLRAAQFSGRFEFAVTARTADAMTEAAPLAATVSAERVQAELMKLLEEAARPSVGIELMRETEVLRYVLPELLEGYGVDQNEWHAYDVYVHSLVTLDAAPREDPLLRLAALLHDVGKPRTKDGPHFYRHEIVGEELVRDILTRLRFSHEAIETVAHLVREHMFAASPELSDKAVRRFIRRIGVEHLDRQFGLRYADVVGSGLPPRDDSNERFEDRVHALLAERPPLSVRDLAVDGTDVIAALVRAGRLPPGSRGGPEVGTILRNVLERVLDEPGLGRDAQLALIREAAAVSRET